MRNPDDPAGAKKKLLLFKVQGVRMKLILLRQHKLKRYSFLRKLIVQRLSSVFPTSEQVYNGLLRAMRLALVESPVRFGRWAYHTRLMQSTIGFMRNFYFAYRMLYNLFYYTRLTMLKLKFLWDTLDHYLLIKHLAKLAWREKLISATLVGYATYFLYFREAYFMSPARDYIWLQEVTNHYDKLMRARAKSLLRDDVFGNPEMPGKVGPLLVQLV